MSESLTARLRDEANIVPHEHWSWLRPLLLESAAEIERLENLIQTMKTNAKEQRESDELAGYGWHHD